MLQLTKKHIQIFTKCKLNHPEFIALLFHGTELEANDEWRQHLDIVADWCEEHRVSLESLMDLQQELTGKFDYLKYGLLNSPTTELCNLVDYVRRRYVNNRTT